MNLSEYSESISLEYTEDDLEKLIKIQELFDKCMENAERTKKQLFHEAIAATRAY